MRRRRAIIALGIALGVGGAAPLRAQAPGAIAGRVIDATSDSAVAGAFVLIEGTLGRSVTDANGRYVLRDVDPGRRLVRVLRIGYQTGEHAVSVTAGDTAHLDFALPRALVRLEPVTVTASRGTRSIGDVPASQAVVPSQELRNRNVLTLDQALPFVSGVSFNDGDIDIRGSTGAAGGVGSRVLLLLDGHSVLTADGAETDFTSLPLLDVDRVEVVKGAYSALYGSNALGGVVNIVTTPVEGPPETVADLHYGAYDQPSNYRFGDTKYPDFAGFMLQHSREIGDVGVRGVVEGETSDGFRQDDHSSRWFLRGKVDVPAGADHPVSAYVIYTTQDVGNFFMWDSSATPTRPPANTLNDWAHDTKLSVGATVTPIARENLRL
ncbi:MAG TPA: TonB-dependent receptor, partial [Gemmatimonadaceae bacterium]